MGKIPKIRFDYLRKFFVFFLIASVFFGAGYLFGFSGFQTQIAKFPLVTISRTTPPEKNLDFGLFWKVWDTLATKYYDQDKISESELVYGAIKGMVAAVGDPYTVFLSPKENRVVQEDLQGNFEGVGIQIGFRGTQLAVIAPLPESPAEEAGVKAGDLIVGIKDEAKKVDRGTVGITLPEAVQIIRGPRGSKVTLALLREGVDEPMVVDILRESINVPSVVVVNIKANDALEGEENIAQIKVLKFAGETLGEWEKAVAEILKNPKITAVIVDVRNNPGGYLQGAIDLASDFLDTGDIVVYEEDYNGDKEEFKVERLPRLKNYKVVVLVNKGSASASEILAGALRDQKKITLVGETTFGKGTIQEPQQINGGSGLHITIAKWLTPSGIWVNEKGLEPDVIVEDNAETEEDEKLTKAIEIVNSQ